MYIDPDAPQEQAAGTTYPLTDVTMAEASRSRRVGAAPLTAAMRTCRQGLSRFVRRFDARSAAVLLSTSGALPLPLIALVDPTFIRPDGLPLLIAIWAFTLVVFVSTIAVGKLGDRLFAAFGLIGMVGIAVGSGVVVEPSAAGVTITLLGAIPAIAAMSSPRLVVASFAFVAIVLATALTFIEPTSAVSTVVKLGASVTNVTVPVFIVTALRRSLELSMRRYAVLGDTDPLTGLLNRRGFLSCSRDLLQSVAADGDQIGFLLIDVDHFKDVNDRLGHAVGDTVLVEAVRSITRAAPPNCLIGRLGGEEFVVLCATVNHSTLSSTAERIRAAVATDCTITVSIGAVAAPLSGARSGLTNISQVIDHLTRLADRWVYVAKSAGRNRVVCLSSSPIYYVDGDTTRTSRLTL